MKTLVAFVVCGVALFVGVALLFSGGFWSLCGLVWFLMLYISSEIFPAVWRRFYVANLRILKYFGCL